MRKRSHEFNNLVLNILHRYGEMSSLRLKILVFLYDVAHFLEKEIQYTHVRYVKGIYGFLHTITAKDFEKPLKGLVERGALSTTTLHDGGLWIGYKPLAVPEKSIDVSLLSIAVKAKLPRLIESVEKLTRDFEYGEIILDNSLTDKLNLVAIAAFGDVFAKHARRA